MCGHQPVHLDLQGYYQQPANIQVTANKFNIKVTAWMQSVPHKPFILANYCFEIR